MHSPDLAADDRWPRWARHVDEQLGVGRMLCFQLYTTGKSLGALNLYSNTVDGFNDDDLTAGTFLAAHVAVALAESQNADNLHSSGISRTIIGQAQGILMERYDLDAENAFAVLRRVSQQSNTKLYESPPILITTGQTPGHRLSESTHLPG